MIFSLHSSVSFAEGFVLTGQSNASADGELDVHTVPHALRYCFDLQECPHPVHLCKYSQDFFSSMRGFRFQAEQTYAKKLHAVWKGWKACGEKSMWWYVKEGEKQVFTEARFRGLDPGYSNRDRPND